MPDGVTPGGGEPLCNGALFISEKKQTTWRERQKEWLSRKEKKEDQEGELLLVDKCRKE